MRDELTCDEADDQGFPERYAAGTLDDAAVARFESHFLTCANCQQAVALAATVRRAAAPRRNVVRRWLAPAGAVLAAGLALFAQIHLRAGDAVRSLGRLDAAPAYAGVAVRGATSPLDSAFGAAMGAYAAGHYDSAIPRLRALAASGAAPAPVNFFLGASLLMTRQPGPAAEAFARVIAAGNNPYVADAHWYRALALLQQDRPGRAAAELRAAGTAGPNAVRAADLLHRLEARRTP
ncbi:MAG: tetratricopeptide repeat protein [Gemmatimonadaceae bacterium]